MPEPCWKKSPINSSRSIFPIGKMLQQNFAPKNTVPEREMSQSQVFQRPGLSERRSKQVEVGLSRPKVLGRRLRRSQIICFTQYQGPNSSVFARFLRTVDWKEHPFGINKEKKGVRRGLAGFRRMTVVDGSDEDQNLGKHRLNRRNALIDENRGLSGGTAACENGLVEMLSKRPTPPPSTSPSKRPQPMLRPIQATHASSSLQKYSQVMHEMKEVVPLVQSPGSASSKSFENDAVVNDIEDDEPSPVAPFTIFSPPGSPPRRMPALRVRSRMYLQSLDTLKPYSEEPKRTGKKENSSPEMESFQRPGGVLGAHALEDEGNYPESKQNQQQGNLQVFSNGRNVRARMYSEPLRQDPILVAQSAKRISYTHVITHRKLVPVITSTDEVNHAGRDGTDDDICDADKVPTKFLEEKERSRRLLAKLNLDPPRRLKMHPNYPFAPWVRDSLTRYVPRPPPPRGEEHGPSIRAPELMIGTSSDGDYSFRRNLSAGTRSLAIASGRNAQLRKVVSPPIQPPPSPPPRIQTRSVGIEHSRTVLIRGRLKPISRDEGIQT